MTGKPTSFLVAVIVGLVVLAAAGPALSRLAGALVTPILVGGVVVAVLRLLWFYTR